LIDYLFGGKSERFGGLMIILNFFGALVEILGLGLLGGLLISGVFIVSHRLAEHLFRR